MRILTRVPHVRHGARGPVPSRFGTLTRLALLSACSFVSIAAVSPNAIAQGTQQLPGIVVEGAQSGSQTSAAGSGYSGTGPGNGPSGPVQAGDTINRGTSGIDGYLATGTSTATKTNTPIIDIPQSVSIVTKEFAKDTGAYSVAGALLYVPGVVVQQGEGHRDQITIRGQETNADFFTDGVRDDIQYYRDLYNVEAVEVLKGSAALAFGRGGAGGVVNRVLKKANGEKIYYGSATLGSFGKKYFAADVGDKISDSVAVRLNAFYEDSDSFRDFFEMERIGINPTVAFKLGPKTKIHASYEYRSDDRTVDRGVPSLNNRPIEGFQSIFFGNPDVSYTEFEGHVATATLEHEFDGGLQVRSHLSYNHYDKIYQNIFATGPVDLAAPGNEVVIGGYVNDTDRESVFTQTDLSYQFNTGSQIRHTLVAGFEYSQQDQFNSRDTPSFNAPNSGIGNINVPLSNPTSFTPVFFDQVARRRDSEVTNTGFYIQDQVEITKYFEVIGGLRWDRFEIDFEETNQNFETNRTDTEVSPRIGAIVKPMDGLSIYGSWSRTFLPSAGDQFDNLSVTNADLEPEEFENKEIGVKWEALPRLFLTAAYFDLDRTNQTVTVAPGVTEQVGATNTKGFELEAYGYLTDQWQIKAGYSNQRSEITDNGDNSNGRLGNSVEGVPRHIFSAWTKYDFTRQFAAAAGVIHQSSHFAQVDNTTLVPGYTRVDAALYYNFNENWSAQLNVENIFDVDYFASAHNNNNISPGAPRQAFVTLQAKF